MNPRGFEIRGLEHLRERFSKRSRQVQKLADDFAEAKGRRPTKAEVEVLVRQSRADKLTEISTADVRTQQRQQLSGEEARALDQCVRDARAAGQRQRRSTGLVRTVLEAAFRHVYETNSVVREGDVLNAALELYPDFTRWRELREALVQAGFKDADTVQRFIVSETARAQVRGRVLLMDEAGACPARW
jgi:hypothetical protein